MKDQHRSSGSCPPNQISRRGFLLTTVASTTVLRSGYADAEVTKMPTTKAGARYPMHAITRGPKSHFFGYYDKCPWDRTGRYLLGMEIGFCDRQPNSGELLTVGMVDLQGGNRYVPFDETTGWSWQQGTMLQWLGSAPDREVIYNSVDSGNYVSIIRDVHSGKTRKLPRPVYAVSADGTQAVTLDFDRVHRMRPGYGYMAIPERFPDVAAPREAGLYWTDLRSGEHKLVIPIEWAANNKRDDRFKDAHHWFNHLQFNPSGTRFLFLHRWRPPTKPWHTTRMYTAKPDGSDIRLHSDSGMVSHFDWRDDHTILAWAKGEPKGNRFYLFDVQSNEVEVVGDGILTGDGHCSYSPDRKWILTDSYPDKNNMQHLMLYRVVDRRLFDVGLFYLSPQLKGKPYRCDLHPRWNRDGTQVCIDSAHDGTRQLYVLDVRQITRGS